MYFIMIWSQDGKMAMPMIDKDNPDDVAFYHTEEDARTMAKQHPLCLAFGYEIHCMGLGES